ncbi:MAG: hypothetical protein IJ605_03425 [Prevotella sp.]|nr:hypothetical protein [Prevotella sp.]
MMKNLLRLWFLMALLLVAPAQLDRVVAQELASNGQQQSIRRDGAKKSLTEKRQHPLGDALVKSQPSHRVVVSRLSRQLPTHGGKPGRSLGSGALHRQFNPFHLSHRNFCCRLAKSGRGFALPRHYYIIALRRILC